MSGAGRLLRTAELGAACQPWQAPDVRQEVDRAAAEAQGPVQADLTATVAAAEAAGRQAGYAEGLAEAHDVARSLDAIVRKLERPLQHLDDAVEQEILALIITICQQLVAREFRADPGHLLGVIREALTVLPVGERDITVRLNTHDAGGVRACLADLPDLEDRRWRIEADPLMGRGDCEVVTPNSRVDGRLEARLAQVVAGMLDDTRGGSSDDV